MVGAEGEQLGIVPIADAIARAEAAELDLVEIAPTGRAAGLPDHGFRQVQVPRGEEPARGEAQAEADPGQGSQVPARNRRRRLQDQAAQPDPVPGRRRQGQGHLALPRARDGAPGIRHTPARAHSRRSGAARDGRAVSKTRRPADGDAAGPEESGTAAKHHPNKPEAGKAQATKASPPESTAVGSK